MLSKQALRVILSLTGADDFEAGVERDLLFFVIHANRTRLALENVCHRIVLDVVPLTKNSQKNLCVIYSLKNKQGGDTLMSYMAKCY
jgi:hypothetical protein